MITVCRRATVGRRTAVARPFIGSLFRWCPPGRHPCGARIAAGALPAAKRKPQIGEFAEEAA